MKNNFTMPTKEESARLVAAMRDEDIDTSDMPDRGGSTDWRPWKDRRAAFNKQREQSA
jgi:hypothetical protein